MTCSRCQRLNLECKIESNFKRVGKRSKNAEMEREIVELRKQLASQQASPTTVGLSIKASLSASASPTISQLPSHMDQYMPSVAVGSEEAVASLMDLRSGREGGSFMRSPNAQLLRTRQLGEVILTHDRVQDLFQQYVIPAFATYMYIFKLTTSGSLRSIILFFPFLIQNSLPNTTIIQTSFGSGLL